MYEGEKNPMYGVSIPCSEEKKRHLSKKFSGKGNPMYGKRVEMTPERREYMSNLFSGEGNPFYGKNHSEETMKKMRDINKKKKPVRCIETGVCYESTNEAQRQTGVNNASISRSCRTGHILAGGYHWEYVA